MINKKFRLLYDARILKAGAKKNSSRSGIYFTALNILKSFVKKDNLKIVLYASTDEKKEINIVLNKEFPNTKFDIIFYPSEKYKKRKDAAFFVMTQDKFFITKFLIKLFFCILDFLYYIQNKLQSLFYYNYDASYSAAYTFPEFIKNLKPQKSYTTLHDLIPFILKNYCERNSGNEWYHKLVKSLNDRDYYFADSENTRKDFLKFAPQMDSNKTYTVLLGCDFCYFPKPDDIIKVKEKYNIPKDKKYLFSLCTLEPRKNLIRTIKTFLQFIEKHNINDLIFVMGGGHWKSFINKWNDETKDLNTDKIFHIGYVDDEDLPVLYNGAEWFTYTSQYEGFGLPVLEAMNCGCPVITSNNSSLPEVIGDCGIQIDWDSDEQHIQAYEKYYFDENLRKENAKKGRERAKLFSWDKTTDKMLSIMIDNNS